MTSSQWGEVAARDPDHTVTQVFGSALPVAYNRTADPALWAPLAQLVLRASYRATLHAACEAKARHRGAHGSGKVFFTLLGGGVFGNKLEWIADAMREACVAFAASGLQVIVVSYGSVARPFVNLCREFGLPPTLPLTPLSPAVPMAQKQRRSASPTRQSTVATASGASALEAPTLDAAAVSAPTSQAAVRLSMED